jgi:hypothetical protein
MTTNPLIADPGGPSRFSGTFLLDDIDKLASDIGNGSWMSTGLMSVTTTIDLAATISDPIGSLVAAGLGWLMDHLDPLKTWLNELTGDAGAVEGFAGTWENVAGRLSEEAALLGRRVSSDLSQMMGPAVATYKNFARDLSEHIEALAKASESVAGGLKNAAMVVEAVHGLVRDVLAQVVGSLISYAAEEVFTLGLATPLVIEQATTRVSAATARVSGSVRELVTSVKALKELVESLDRSVGKVRDLLDHVHPEVARGRHSPSWTDPRSPRPSTPHLPKHAAPAASLKDRLGNVTRVEGSRDVVAEGAAAGAQRTRGEEAE